MAERVGFVPAILAAIGPSSPRSWVPGQATRVGDYQTPREFNFSVGVRF